MNYTVLTPVTKEVVIEYTQKTVQLSTKRYSEIEDFWLKINSEGSFHRGEVFTVSSVVDEDCFTKVLLDLTDYAHYLHTVKNNIGDNEGCKVVYGAGLIETSDSKYVFGEMGNHTAHPGRLQFVGGGLNWEDKVGNRFDIKQSILRELGEELGVSNCDFIESCTPKYIKSGGTFDFIVVIYLIKLTITAKELIENYQAFIKGLAVKGEEPEFQNVICLENSKESLQNFLEKDNRPSVDYLRPYLEKAANY